MKYLIVSSKYNEKAGGVIVLHKLCDLLNKLGETSYLCATDHFCRYQYNVNKGGKWRNLVYRLKKPIEYFKALRKLFMTYISYETNPAWNTPVLNPIKFIFNSSYLDDAIVIYPEIVSGNPIDAKNVVRLLMHNPGNFTGQVNYGSGELLYRYSNSFARDFIAPKGSIISEHFLTICSYPSFFSYEGTSKKREGIAYCIRKGKGKKMIHNENNAVLIDDKPLKEVAEILRRVEVFISYDPITALSFFALLCHCPSVIILDNDETPKTYRPESVTNSMFAYNLDYSNKDWEKSYEWAESVRDKVIENSIKNTKQFIIESKSFFNL